MAFDAKIPLATIPDIQQKVKRLTIERRRRARAKVHWRLCFSLPGRSDLVWTVTEDLSSQGFYCIAKGLFVPGEIRKCALIMPTCDRSRGATAIQVACRVRVLRVDALQEVGMHGVACAIEDYSLTSATGKELITLGPTPETVS
jgi:hypothetical protein